MSRSATTLTGLAVPFVRPSQLVRAPDGDYRQWFSRRAFTETLRRGLEIFLAFEHRNVPKLATTQDHSLRLSEGDDGLYFAAELRGEFGLWVADLARQGKVAGASAGFKVKSDDWYTRNGLRMRQIDDADLIEISIIPRGGSPLFPGTYVNALG